ncbi:MAG: CBS domain-containing protein [Chloroflexi bacterium]|nr:CBS domain-containing protein [Chloroflexota bacterium]
MTDIQLMRVKEIMTSHPARIRKNATLERAAELVAMSRVTDLMVVDKQNNFVGVLSEGDILRAALPDINQILDEGGSVETAFDLFLSKGKNLADLPIMPLVIQEPIVVAEDDHVAKATVALIDKQIRLLPVVKDGQLVGTVSRADVCRAVVGTF